MPGVYAALVISDTGQGMDEATKARIFEPFFTTKEVGKGTGLGLSTVFGIVKQSGGHILVYSEAGHGTTFKILLPRIEEGAEPDVPISPSVARGTETILVCEDNHEIRALVRAALISQGYAVLESSSAPEAMQFSTRYTGPIQMLLTDVVLQHGNGPDLAVEFQAARPEAKVLFMSGYTDTGILKNGVVDPGVQFLQKPFTPTSLHRKIREVLDA
jgi:CheY-like chemotaxis protein